MGTAETRSSRSAPQHLIADAQRWELLRALGATVLTPPPGNAVTCEALGLPAQSAAEQTQVFVLSAPPHAAIHLGPEGKLGGEGLDRISGFWRVLGLQPPEDADHLGTLLMLYAELGEAETVAGTERAQAQMLRARTALFHEHLWSWAPGYLRAVESLDVEATTAWARLTSEALRAELDRIGAAAMLPLALRAAPAGLEAADSFDETLDALVSPVRCGLILTYRDLVACGRQAGVGVRRGERRYALKAMLLQDPVETLTWLAGHAAIWSQRHAQDSRTDTDAGAWWVQRAHATAVTLASLADQARAMA